MTTLFSGIEQYENTIAIIDENQNPISYQKLCNDAQALTLEYQHSKQLVFIRAQNNYATVLAYVACVLAGFPVLLVANENQVQLDELISRYHPNIVVTTDTSKPIFKLLNQTDIKLHSELSHLLSTSGSTGSPKLVKLSHGNIKANCDGIIKYLDLTAEDRGITSLPIHYSYGLSLLNIHLRIGASIVLTELSVVNESFWELYKKHKVTSFSGVPYSFQSLESTRFDFNDYPSTRYVTQAGGKLSTTSILHFAKQLKDNNNQFFVMYGQTEASPRISYLPPKYVFEYADCIGVALEYGELAIIDEEDQVITDIDTPGELTYKGPNIMMGYALGPNDFHNKETITELKTGDIALRNEKGLYKIVGRMSRFVKPFGIRVSLDDIQNALSTKGYVVAVTGDDEKIIVAVESKKPEDHQTIMQLISIYKLPPEVFQVETLIQLPRLANDKFDYKKLQSDYLQQTNKQSLIQLFTHEFKQQILNILGLNDHSWESVLQIYETTLASTDITELCTFRSLAGDSLSYVSTSSALEEYLGTLPEDWHNTSIKELEAKKESHVL
ncbi:MAG: AMP-binding protein [Paraglaciecola sp.]|uniref:AMP-binding protein n=2 Tax=Paraglaciecola sp. TaxID=1920173 RepID=UPI0032977CA9